MKKFIVVVVIAIIVAWLAMNWVQGQSLFSNPFADPAVKEQLKSDTQSALESGRDALNKGADKVKDAINN